MAESISADKFLIILGAGPQQIPVYEAASRLGLKTLAVDYNPKAPSLSLADRFILASVNNKNKEECLLKLKQKGVKYSGVVASGIEVSPLAAAIAKEFNLIWTSEEAAYLTTNKCARSTVLKKSGVPLPWFEIIESPAFPKMKPPFVIKPSDNSGSRGVRIVNSEKEWLDAYDGALSFSGDGRVIVEELLQGDEISIEGFILDGKMHIHGFSDRNYVPGFYPYFMEDGSTTPTVLPADVVAEAKNIFIKAVEALGITSGPSKGDLIVTKNGVKVLEITSRLSPLFPMVTPYINGADPLSALILWASGQDVPVSLLQQKFSKAMAHRYFFHKPGQITEIKGLDVLNAQPGIKLVVFLRDLAVGDTLPPSSYVSRPFYLVAVADDRDTAVRQAQNALGTVSINVRP